LTKKDNEFMEAQSINMDTLAPIVAVVCALSGFSLLAMIFFFLSRSAPDQETDQEIDQPHK